MTPPVRRYIITLVALFLAYAAAIIGTSSFTEHGIRWFWLFDDAMISMRYAHNFALGHGLTWNPGERVEGFTNPGWTLIMALVHLVEHRENMTSLWMQSLSALLLAGTIPLTASLGLLVGSRSPLAALTAAAATAFYFPLNYFSLMGMETGALAFLLTLALVLHVRKAETGDISIGAWACLAVAVIVRMDAVVPLMAIAAALFWIVPHKRRAHTVCVVIVLAITLGVPTLLRLSYYHEWLPNTWRLKMTGYPIMSRMERGAWVTSRFLANQFWPIYLIIPVAAIWYFRNRDAAIARIKSLRQSPLLMLLFVFLGQFVYSIYVGGDVWERELYANRFLVIVAPVFFILISQAVVAVVSWIPVMRRSLSRMPACWAIVFGLLLIMQSNWHPGYKWAREQAMFLTPLKDANEARGFVRLALLLRQTTPTDTKIAVERAGTLPYFMPGYTFCDILGKADPIIAREKIHDPSVAGGDSFVPGHFKWDAAYTMGIQKPDILVAGLEFRQPDFAPWLDREYQKVDITGFFEPIYLRKSSAIKLKNLLPAAESGYSSPE